MNNKIFSLAFLFTVTAVAVTPSLNTNIKPFYTSMRAMGQGNAFISKVDDSSTIFYNPAALAFIKKSDHQLTLVGADLGDKTMPFVQDIQDIQSQTGLTDNDKATQIANVIEANYGHPLGFRTSLLEYSAAIKNHGWSFIPAQVSFQIIPLKQLGPMIDLNVYKDTSLSYGYGDNINENLSWGATLNIIHRNKLSGMYSAMELAIDEKSLDFKSSVEGVAGQIDLGFLWKPLSSTTPIENKIKEETVTENVFDEGPLSLGLVVRNAITTGYQKTTYINKDATMAPENDPTLIDVGANYAFIKNESHLLDTSIEFKDILSKDNYLLKSSHLGFEYSYLMSWGKTSVMAGLNQGYYTAGIGFTALFFDLSVVTYGEEVGIESNRIENRVKAVTLGFEF